MAADLVDAPTASHAVAVPVASAQQPAAAADPGMDDLAQRLNNLRK
jgi:hypothetical protein